jgi:hypothetical protein
MNQFIQLKNAALVFLIALFCFGLLPMMQAVIPAPDGGYPGFNTAEGQKALFQLSSGTGNTAIGWFSLASVTAGNFNTGVGAATLTLNTGDENTATGAGALLLNTTGTLNTANGAFALLNNATGSFNTAAGFQALRNNTTGDSNTANGINALDSNTTGAGNTATGSSALSNTTTGNFNTALGLQAGINQDTGSNNIYISDSGLAGESNVIAIGNVPPSLTLYQKFYVGAVFGVTTGSGTALPVIVDDNGQLGTAPSAARFKKEIKPMDKVSESVLALKPVTFHYKNDKKNTPQFGLVAEEVAKVNPQLVARDKDGEIFSVRYDAVNAMLLNEFLKQHRKVQEQELRIAQQREHFETAIAQQRKDFEATIAELKKGIETVTLHLNEQAAQIQKVNTQIEISKAVAVE